MSYFAPTSAAKMLQSTLEREKKKKQNKTKTQTFAKTFEGMEAYVKAYLSKSKIIS